MVEVAARIVADPNIHHGKPVIAGTRVPVYILVQEMSLGTSAEEVADMYGVTPEDVYAALGYAAEAIATDEIRAIA